jgi:UDP-N-acetylglucosamine acyltransferase
MIHPTAIVSSKARVSERVEIGAYSVVGDDVEIGTGTRIGAHVIIEGPTTIGNDNTISPFTSNR